MNEAASVYELTTPTNHNTNKTTKSVHSMALLATGRETAKRLRTHPNVRRYGSRRPNGYQGT
jgi:hypothetical protein